GDRGPGAAIQPLLEDAPQAAQGLAALASQPGPRAQLLQQAVGEQRGLDLVAELDPRRPAGPGGERVHAGDPDPVVLPPPPAPYAAARVMRTAWPCSLPSTSSEPTGSSRRNGRQSSQHSRPSSYRCTRSPTSGVRRQSAQRGLDFVRSSTPRRSSSCSSVTGVSTFLVRAMTGRFRRRVADLLPRPNIRLQSSMIRWYQEFCALTDR